MIHGEKQRLDMSKREDVVPRYIFTPPLYYEEEHEDEELEESSKF